MELGVVRSKRGTSSGQPAAWLSAPCSALLAVWSFLKDADFGELRAMVNGFLRHTRKEGVLPTEHTEYTEN
jgi:hypothetical protein